MKRLPPDWARMLATVDYRRRLALVAERGPSDAPELVGVGRYEPTDDPDTAEIAFVVQDGFQGRGRGSILLRQLLDAAEARGIHRFRAFVLADNGACSTSSPVHARARAERRGRYRHSPSRAAEGRAGRASRVGDDHLREITAAREECSAGATDRRREIALLAQSRRARLGRRRLEWGRRAPRECSARTTRRMPARPFHPLRRREIRLRMRLPRWAHGLHQSGPSGVDHRQRRAER